MTLASLNESFPEKSLIAMIGLKPLPGAPGYEGSEQAIIDRALMDAEVYANAGVDSILIENSADLPYIKPPLPDAACSLVERICSLVRMRFKKPLGLQLLEAANEQAMRIAAATDLDYIRVEGYVFAHIGGAGLIEGCAGKVLRLRKELNAVNVQVFADVKKKHCSHAITGDLALEEHVRQADFFHADGIIVTGPRTGAEPEAADLEAARSACKLPIVIGSGMTVSNLPGYFRLADGFIVGSTFRMGGAFLAELDVDRFESFMDEFRRLKSSDSN
ncbi:MAG: BtpA/SgcQ family protein [Puniceicoccaceae bacterium]